MQKPSLPEGTRDFGPEQVRRRTYIFDTVRSVMVKFGFQPLETPAMENLSTLTGKYGDEGDKLLFKILNNGDYLAGADEAALAEKNSARLTSSIAKRGLRYDLTVPFARYVVMNRGTLAFPFKRYQIQPVWRADRPQRGRYREFFQCDADVIGSDSLQFEAELVQIYDEAFAKLGIPVTIKINNRKILYGISEIAGIPEKFRDLTTIIDKLDKIGMDGIRREMYEHGFAPDVISQVDEILTKAQNILFGTTTIEELRMLLNKSEVGINGLGEIQRVARLLENVTLRNEVRFDPTLARGLSYYTGCIFEVAAQGIQMGSIGGGGRYADLTGVFGVPGLSGVGISFGADRIYDVMSELNLFPESLSESVQVLLAAFDEATHEYAFGCAARLRAAGLSVELYPEPGKLKKQFEYAAKRNVPFVAIVGETEMQSETLMLKDQKTGEQQAMTVEEAAKSVMRDEL